MVIIRFVRVGRKNQAFFHLVAAEKSKAVQKKHIEKLGYYNPHFEKGKGELVVVEDRVKHYLSHGAQMSETAARLLTKHGIKEAGKFVTERSSKPKKTPAPTEAPVAPQAPSEEISTPATETTEEKSE
ncbi:30S ribosomal protein S16 [Candidatus Gracilibacteria bacterium]|nr:30S ribosomal protein S16 [Candidatus Gracilibacteria bacterium]